MNNVIDLKGIVKQKCVEKEQTEYTTYIPQENQLVIVKDGDNYSLVRGDGVHAVNECPSVSGDSELPLNQNYGIKMNSNPDVLALREATSTAIQDQEAQGQQGYGAITSANYNELPFPIILTEQTFDPNEGTNFPGGYPIGTMAITEYQADESWRRSIVVYMGTGKEGAGPQIAILETIDIDEPTQPEE